MSSESPPSALHIELATGPAGLARALPLVAKFRHQMGYPEVQTPVLSTWLRRYVESGGGVLLATMDGQAIGTLLFSSVCSPETLGLELVVDGLFVERGSARGGQKSRVGYRLMDRVTSIAVARGASRVSGYVPPGNKPLRRYWSRYGFLEEEWIYVTLSPSVD